MSDTLLEAKLLYKMCDGRSMATDAIFLIGIRNANLHDFKGDIMTNIIY